VDPPDRPTKHKGQPVILLSAFDGIGCAKLALDQAMARTDCWLMAYIAWEIDEDCCRLTTNAHGAQHRGDFTRDDLDALTETINQLDPHAQAILVFCAGPPCPDYSRITEGPGREGTEGIKFEIYAKWLKEAHNRFKPRRTAKLIENVIPHRRGDIQYFEEKLQCTAVILEAMEFKRISRPRTWWTSINWDSIGTTLLSQQSLAQPCHGRNTLALTNSSAHNRSARSSSLMVGRPPRAGQRATHYPASPRQLQLMRGGPLRDLKRARCSQPPTVVGLRTTASMPLGTTWRTH
jgi:hypothetical protein